MLLDRGLSYFSGKETLAFQSGILETMNKAILKTEFQESNYILVLSSIWSLQEMKDCLTCSHSPK